MAGGERCRSRLVWTWGWAHTSSRCTPRRRAASQSRTDRTSRSGRTWSTLWSDWRKCTRCRKWRREQRSRPRPCRSEWGVWTRSIWALVEKVAAVRIFSTWNSKAQDAPELSRHWLFWKWEVGTTWQQQFTHFLSLFLFLPLALKTR